MFYFHYSTSMGTIVFRILNPAARNDMLTQKSPIKSRIKMQIRAKIIYRISFFLSQKTYLKIQILNIGNLTTTLKANPDHRAKTGNTMHRLRLHLLEHDKGEHGRGPGQPDLIQRSKLLEKLEIVVVIANNFKFLYWL